LIRTGVDRNISVYLIVRYKVMSNYFLFTTIFQVKLVKAAPAKIVRDPVKIEFFSGPRSLRVPVQENSIAVKGADTPIAEDTTLSREAILQLSSDSKYVMITARTKERNPTIARKFCESTVDRAITDLTVLYDRGIFAKLIYRGWLVDDNFIVEAWFSVHAPIEILPNTESVLWRLSKNQNTDADINQRYSIMSRFYSKSILVQPSEEKLLYLWTILEIFPMKNTTNIQPISEYLAARINRSSTDVKERLAIGRASGVRSDLVHNGILNIDSLEMGKFFEKLESICIEVLRGMSGIEYDGALEKYFV
jgi:hypothetical protein